MVRKTIFGGLKFRKVAKRMLELVYPANESQEGAHSKDEQTSIA